MIWLLANWRMIAAAVVMALSYYGGYRTATVIHQAEESEKIQEFQDRTKSANDAALKAEIEIADLRAKNRRINALLARELKNPAYDCPVPAGGVRAINDAVSDSTGKPHH